jgi:hypothetical protein
VFAAAHGSAFDGIRLGEVPAFDAGWVVEISRQTGSG